MSAPSAIGSYIPLRGDELKKVIIKKFEVMLGDYPAWSASIAHINPKIKMTLNMQTFPYDPGRKLDLETTLRHDTHKSDPPVGNTEIPKVNKTLESEQTITSADEARQDANLVVPQKQETPDGQIVDFTEDTFGEFDRGQGGSERTGKGADGTSGGDTQDPPGDVPPSA